MDAAYLNYVPPPGLSSGGFALDDIDEEGHTKQAGGIPACSHLAPLHSGI
jgi:hypothetical protein